MVQNGSDVHIHQLIIGLITSYSGAHFHYYELLHTNAAASYASCRKKLIEQVSVMYANWFA
ncbi:hypothetical protein BIFGAL_04367 [Bifidobacterium gallicum DSM 20093 = LMG 11596]|uniref:Uncharacterized protein n=1 Tax=Bifidobacterium gallicum DSM 20093 = LMG 11596 TaxID=561180 RepID=D1NWW0_9BIFI|nr:hypothetical protein BIFGAL_04367 [Bifidobacterium gallicum DSM 20093 = LMG 11596]KFI57506.1 hypothetical protein BGLCM_1451 [Bifidobacterium gallicum DSM 20093 = LMG 11596]